MRRVLVLALLAACGGGDDPALTPDAGDPATIPLRGVCPLDQRLGGFTVAAHTDYSIIEGTVSDGVVPISVLEEVSVDGDCRLMRRRNPFCDPPCRAGETCNFQGQCIPFPTPLDVGEVTLAGLMGEPVVMQPRPPGNNYFATGLPNPVFAPGKLVTMSTSNGSLGHMQLHGVGSESLAVAASQWNIEKGSALEIQWTAPAASSPRTSVRLTISIDQHGTSPVAVHCTFDDDGSGTISQTVVDALVDSGVSGFPSGSLRRQTADRIEVGGGCVELSVESPRQVDVRVAGHTPCTGPGQCPSGQMCDLATETCK